MTVFLNEMELLDKASASDIYKKFDVTSENCIKNLYKTSTTTKIWNYCTKGNRNTICGTQITNCS